VAIECDAASLPPKTFKPVEILEIESLISLVLFFMLKIGIALLLGIELLKLSLQFINDKISELFSFWHKN
jgi:hypothetical protein|tara:strand:- start:215 stop:424 length:210 start_codon:yes stop_codon:yes gene_type:complete